MINAVVSFESHSVKSGTIIGILTYLGKIPDSNIQIGLNKRHSKAKNSPGEFICESNVGFMSQYFLHNCFSDTLYSDSWPRVNWCDLSDSTASYKRTSLCKILLESDPFDVKKSNTAIVILSGNCTKSSALCYFTKMTSRQVVLVTGCSAGIGKDLAVLLARDPQRRFTVYATMRNMVKRQDELKTEAGSTLDDTMFIRELDVTKQDVIRHRSVTCNRIISMSTGSRFQVLNYDQSDHHTNSMASIVVMNGAWSSHQGVT